ncbi:MAG: rhodanese-like domain-containing protein [Nanobdellota archaeon]
MTIKDIDAQEAKRLLDEMGRTREFEILDVRTPPENQSEKISDGKLIDITQGDFQQQAAELDKNKTYLVYCRTGSRSRFAVNILENLGFSKIYHLEHGIMEWKMQGLSTI